MPDPLAGLPMAGLPLASSTDIASLLEALQATSPGLLEQLTAGGALPGLQGVGAQVNAPPPVAAPAPGAQTQAQQAQAASQTLTPVQQSVLPQAMAAVQTAIGLGGAVQQVGQAGVTPSSVAGLAGPVLDTAAIAAELLKANPDLVLALKAGADAAPIVSRLLSPAFRQILAGGGKYGLGGAITSGAGLAGLGANLGGTLAAGLGAPNELSFGLQQAGALAGGIGALSSIASQGAAQAAATAGPALGTTLGPAIGGASLGQGLGALLSIPGTVAWFMDAQARADERRRMGNQAGAMFQELRAKGLPRAQQGFMQMLQGNLGGADAVAEAMQDLIRLEYFTGKARGSTAGTGVPELRQNIMQSVARLGPQAFDAVMDRLVARADQPSADKFSRGMLRALEPGKTQLTGDVPAIARWLGNFLGARTGVEQQVANVPTERFYGMVPQGSRYARPAATAAVPRTLTATEITRLPRQSLQQAMQDPWIAEYLRRMG
jgi:hypothetical protein